MTGTEAARAAVEDAAVRMATGVPGFPINGLFTALQQSGMHARWQLNEKIAYEMAMGASACGDRAVVVAKHVGLNVMADPLIISATHGIGAGIVVIAGDDVGATMSQDEQDSRWYGRLADIPVYDPSTPGELYDSIMDAIMLSEQISAPGHRQGDRPGADRFRHGQSQEIASPGEKAEPGHLAVHDDRQTPEVSQGRLDTGSPQGCRQPVEPHRPKGKAGYHFFRIRIGACVSDSGRKPDVSPVARHGQPVPEEEGGRIRGGDGCRPCMRGNIHIHRDRRQLRRRSKAA